MREEASVLILGESGTGKELVARKIHKRSDRPLIKVNCASVPRDLQQSEFFGHMRGAFTGVVKDRGGRFELADGGTLFLDEVGEIPLELQSKLLRVLQEGQFERAGEEKMRPVEARIVAATNRDLQVTVGGGPAIPPGSPLSAQRLRDPGRSAADRGEDIPLSVGHFLDCAARKLTRPPRVSHRRPC